jgi:hypothetical protein
MPEQLEGSGLAEAVGREQFSPPFEAAVAAFFGSREALG